MEIIIFIKYPMSTDNEITIISKHIGLILTGIFSLKSRIYKNVWIIVKCLSKPDYDF